MLSIKHLDGAYGSSRVLQDISLVLAPRQSVALLGRNGAGKTTLLKSIVGSPEVTVQGSVMLDSTELLGLPTYMRARMGVTLVPEDRRVYSHMTVAENLLMPLRHCRKEESVNVLLEICRDFPMLKNVLNNRGDALSGGQKQLVAIARGIIAAPRYILLDEPAEGVAPIIRQDMAARIDAARRQNDWGLMIAEQNLEFVRRCTDYFYVIELGELKFEGTWEEFDARKEEIQHALFV